MIPTNEMDMMFTDKDKSEVAWGFWIIFFIFGFITIPWTLCYWIVRLFKGQSIRRSYPAEVSHDK